MDVFISWSGERSRAAAEALRGWLPKIINAIKPWLSSEDIDKGARWGTDVATRLEAAKAGIICLTPSNLHSDWILFEAGALSKTLKNTFVCPLLIGLEPSDVKPPLAQFQATRAEKEDVLKLLKTLNSALGDNALPEAHIDEAFEVWWPKLDFQLKKLPEEESKTKPHRPDRELLEEILALARNQNRPPDNIPSIRPSPFGERTIPYDVDPTGMVSKRLTAAAKEYGVTITRITRVASENPETRKYLIELQNGHIVIVEGSDKGPYRQLTIALATEFKTALKRLVTKQPNNT